MTTPSQTHIDNSHPEETTMTDQFIDRAKLEAMANDMDPTTSPSGSEITWPNSAIKELVRMAFMAGVDATTEQLLANAETEWGVATLWAMSMRGHEPQPSEEAARTFAERYDVPVVSRRALRTAWTTHEEGK